MTNRSLVAIAFASYFATSTTGLCMDRDARLVLSGGGGFTSIEESEVAAFGAGAMLALDKHGVFAIDFSGSSFRDSGETNEEGSQFATGLNWFPSDKLQLRLGGFYTSSEWDGSATIVDAQRRTLISSWKVEGESSGVEFDIKYRFIPAREDISPYLTVGVGASMPEADVKNGHTFAVAPSGYYFKQTGTRYNEFNNVPVEYDLSTVFSATLGVGVDVALTHNIGLNVYGLVGLSQYDHEATLWWDTPINQSDSTFWSLGANIKWYWDMPKGADSIARQ